MSDIQRSFAKQQYSKLPPQPPPIFDEREEDGDDDSALASVSPNESSSSASSTGTIVPSMGKKLFERPPGARNGPLHWQDFFTHELNLESCIDDLELSQHVYLVSPTSNGPLIVTHHGAGSSGLSFATFAKELLQAIPNAGVLSIDARGHGQTKLIKTSTPLTTVELDLGLSTLAADLARAVDLTASRLDWAKMPDIILIGHSLGGAVVTEVAHQGLLGRSVLGYGVLDVVEGSAMDALQSMESYLSTRPRSFTSIASGIEWHTRSRTIRNTMSARVSVPPLLKEETASKWVWRTDLAATKPFWEGWFIGLSKKFLQARGGKLLILAGTDRLDKELMIGQMQGKYQLQVFPEAGHFVHEDQPAKTAQIVADFYRRNDRSALVLPPKVDDLIRQGKLKPAAAE